MSKIKNGGLDQYGDERFEQLQFGPAGVERVNSTVLGRHPLPSPDEATGSPFVGLYPAVFFERRRGCTTMRCKSPNTKAPFKLRMFTCTFCRPKSQESNT